MRKKISKPMAGMMSTAMLLSTALATGYRPSVSQDKPEKKPKYNFSEDELQKLEELSDDLKAKKKYLKELKAKYG